MQNAPANCGFSEGKLRRVIDNNDIQNAFGKEKRKSNKTMTEHHGFFLQQNRVHYHENIISLVK